MYDEDLIEDSLAFAKQLKAIMEKQQAADAGKTATVQNPATSSVQAGSAVQGTGTQAVPPQSSVTSPVQGQPMQRQVTPTGTVPSTQGQSLVSPVQRQPAARPVQGQTTQGQVRPAGTVPPAQGQPMARPVQGQPVPGQVRPAGTVPPAQGQPMQSQPVARPVQGQPMQSQPVARPVQGQPMQGQPVARPAQGQPVPRQVRPAGTVLPAQGQPVASPVQGQPMQSQPMARPVQGQPMARPAQGQPMQGQPAARPVQRQPMQGQPVAGPVQGQPMQGQPMASPAGTVPPAQGQSMASPVQGQPMQGQPVARPAQGQTMQGQPAARPVQGQPMQGQPIPGTMQAPSHTMTTASPDRMAQPESEVANEAIQKLKAMRQEESKTPQPIAAQPQPMSGQTRSTEPTLQQAEEDKNHTYEITIKFDLENIKKKFKGLKEKLAPEERTLEDINAAMEENRQRIAEDQAGEEGTPGENQIAAKAKGMVKKLPNLLKKQQIEEAVPLDDVDALDAEIKTLDDDGAGGKLAARLEDMKEGLPQKASYASKLVTNAVILVLCVGIAYFFASFVTSYVAHQTKVEGESMEPTLSDGDNVIIQRLSYYFKDPSRYDVVVFPVSYDEMEQENTYYIKRVIGLPGEKVQIIDGSVYINDNQLKDDKYALSDILEAGVAADPLVLGENQYFVMGDNRNMSTDSRNSYVGLVNRNDIVGEAWICTWPLNHFGSLKR